MTNTIGIIFSKDRPLQLTATIETLLKHCKDIENIELFVLYKTTSEKSKKLYNLVKNNFENIIFIEENNFRQDLLKILENKEYVLFVVDDCVFTEDFEISFITEKLYHYSPVIGFSLRLGNNINYCYPVRKYQNIPYGQTDVFGIARIYDWRLAELDFNYPLELSSSFYKIDVIKSILKGKYRNPNELESWMAMNVTSFYKERGYLIFYNKSRAFCIPANKVQTIYNNRSMNNLKYTPENLMNLYEQGMRIDISKFDRFLNNACHQEVDFDFVHSSQL